MESPAKTVTRIGTSVFYQDGSTLTCATPAAFKRDKCTVGGEQAKVLMKLRRHLHESIRRHLRLGSGKYVSRRAVGQAVAQSGLGAPDTPVPPEKSVTSWMGYLLASGTGLDLIVNLGFLDYDDVTLA